jgi:hypothetical protein
MKKAMALLAATIILMSSAHAGINIFGGYSLADKTNGVAGNFTVVDNIGGALSFGAEYTDKISEKLGFAVGGTYFLSRTFTSYTSNAAPGTTFLYTAPQPTLGGIVLHANGKYSISSVLYVLGGINFLIPQTTNLTAGASIGGALGTQFGAGCQLSKDFSFEGFYRILNTSTKIGSITMDSYSLSGLELQVKYSL